MDQYAEKTYINQETNGDNREELTANWGMALEAAVCERCDWSYLFSQGSAPQHCPHCYQCVLVPLSEGISRLPYTHPPELLLPFSLNANLITEGIKKFTKGIPLAPYDLNPKILRSRLQSLYLPMWLVDAEVNAIWQAEAGFNYRVVSHQDRYVQSRGGWSSQEVEEERIRWEPRFGKLARSYKNIPSPALEEHDQLNADDGNYDLSSEQGYKPDAIEGSIVCLPNRAPEDAWSEAKLAFQAAAADECRQATEADHLRQFSWQPEYRDLNWTLLLMPLFSTYYLDDDGNPQPILINGQSGRVSGSRRASMKRAWRTALVILGVAIIILILSLLAMATSPLFPPLMAIGVITLTISLLTGAGAILPIAAVWWFNRHRES